MTSLSVNINKIALVRNSRDSVRPNPVELARMIIESGADGITVHPRPDQRHIRPSDVHEVADAITDYSDTEYNIEGNPSAGPRENGFPGFYALVEAVRPDQCTLVPDSDDQLTSDHGWDLSDADRFTLVERYVNQFQDLGSRVSLFMDPDLSQIALANKCGADRIELYTGPYAAAVDAHGIDSPEVQECLSRFHVAATYAHEMGLGVNAGHDLDLDNLAAFCACGEIDEVSIGHALISDALEIGIREVVYLYLKELGG